MKKTLSLILATLFALSAVAVAGETSAPSSEPANSGPAASASNEGSAPVVKQSAKKKKKKKKKKKSTA